MPLENPSRTGQEKLRFHEIDTELAARVLAEFGWEFDTSEDEDKPASEDNTLDMTEIMAEREKNKRQK